MIVYQGIFFDEKTTDFIRSIEKNKLPISVKKLHCVFKFHPRDDEAFDDIVGEEVEVFLTGYGCDGRNSGFSVALSDNIRGYYMDYDEMDFLNNKGPYITTSVAENVNEIDTKNLDFEYFPEPYIVKGKLGYYIGGRTSAFVSYAPQINVQRVRKRV